MEDPSTQWQQSDLLGLLGGPAVPAGDRAAAGVHKGGVELPPLSSRTPGGGAPRCPDTLLILDTETTGLSPAEGQCIEVGAILFAVAPRAVLTQVSFLLPCERNPAEAINGIAASATRLSQPWQAALNCFQAMVEHCDAVLAHNAVFDRQWFSNAGGALGAIPLPWICSMDDIRWPQERLLKSNPSVRDLALAYGVPVWAAHRALTDCIYLAQVLERCDDLEQLLEAALEPRSLFRAQLSYSERHQAKNAGFRWNDPVQGAWTRRLSAREARALPFPVQLIEATAAGADSWPQSA
ncbi:MAG: 3'-5' exonuclease [Cyanobacteria bacterium M_surface_9_m1_291]|nr:3'-5' exonuclease [Cyanobacteria bacterium M_surface_9_m1_291]